MRELKGSSKHALKAAGIVLDTDVASLHVNVDNTAITDLFGEPVF